MPAKKRFFTRNKEKIGNKSVNIREKELKVLVKEAKKEIKVPADTFKPLELPKISHFITEVPKRLKAYIRSRSSPHDVMVGIFLLIVVSASIWQAVLFVQKALELQSVVIQRMKLSQDLGLWKGIAQKYPTYRDAYFQAAVLAYRLGDMNAERVLIGKTLQLDPNYLPAQNLEKISH